MCSYYQKPADSYVIPFDIEECSASGYFKNSECAYESWFIENPVTKDLTKRITLKLVPGAD